MGARAVVRIDAVALTRGPAALRAVLDAELAGRADQPALLQLAGAWDDVRAEDDIHDVLAGVTGLTLAIGPVPAALAGAFDLVAGDDADADAWSDAWARAPFAAVTAARLLRRPAPDVAQGLAAESAAYSMLLASPEFTAWRASHPPRPVVDDPAPRVRVERAGRTTVVTLTRPERHNALDPRLRDELHAALTDALGANGPVVLRGDGPSFCSGGDLDTFGTSPDPATAHIIRLTRSLGWLAHQLRERLVVGLHGTCLGAGIEVPAFAGRVIAADDARLGLPELGLGLVPGAGGTVSITQRIGSARVLELLLGDGTIPAATARDWGLVDEVVPAARLDAWLLEAAESLP